MTGDTEGPRDVFVDFDEYRPPVRRRERRAARLALIALDAGGPLRRRPTC